MKKKLAGFLSFILFLCASSTAFANLITNPGFETDEETFIFGHPGLPTGYGDWGGDLSDIVVDPNGGSNHVLQFLSAGNNMVPNSLSSSEIWQLIDVSSYATDITAGNITANLSGWFNRVAGDSQTDTDFNIVLYALTGNPASFAPGGTSISNGITTDGDIATWEQAEILNWLLPTDTDYLAVRITASENIFNDSYGHPAPEFDGHYADNITLTLKSSNPVPEPATMLLFAVGLGLLGFTKLDRKKFNQNKSEL